MAQTPEHPDETAALSVNERMAVLIAGLDFAAEFEAAGQPYTELDEHGQVVVRYPNAKQP
jgi:hypothetical protein